MKRKDIKNLITDFYFLVENLMGLDLTNFERDRSDTKIEGGFFNADNHDFFITINKENLIKILKGEKLELYRTWEGINIRALEKWVKKELTLSLISDEERRMNQTEALPIGNKKESKTVEIKISNRLVEELKRYEGGSFANDYTYRYDKGGNKMHFYVSDSHEREILKDDLDFFRKVYNLTYPKDNSQK